jgi:hypothetical protein
MAAPAHDYFADKPCPECGSAVRPESAGRSLDDGRTVSSFYACEGPEHHKLAAMSDDLPDRGARYRLVLQAP